jgi:hypothetical protein
MASMADVVSNSMRAQLQTVATMQELLNPPQQEEGLIGVVKEGIRAFAEFASTKAEAEAKAKTERPALPASSGVTTGGAPAAPTPLDDGEEVELSEAAPDEIMAEVIRQLQAHAAPAEVANLYVEALRENPGFVAIVKQAGGTVNAFQARLGSWATAKENYDYLRQVLGALEEIGKRMKQRPPPRPEQAGTTKPAEPAQPAAQPAA